MVKHILIPHTGFFISFEHAKEIDWEHARALIHCDLIEISQARFAANNFEMLMDEEALLKRNNPINHQATQAYRSYWIRKNTENPGTIDMERVDRTEIHGNVLLVKKSI